MSFAVIFDMDGVLIDSNELIWKAINHTFKPYGCQLEHAEIKHILGVSLRDNLKVWKERFGIDISLDEFREKVDAFQFKNLNTVKPDKNLLRLLAELAGRGVPLGVGTSSSRNRAERILAHLGIMNHFPVIIGAEDVTEHKPNPHIFLEAASRLQMKPQWCAVIEDAKAGIEAARRAQMKAIGIVHQYQQENELQHADLVVQNFTQLTYGTIERLFR